MDNKYYIAPFILFTFDFIWLTFFMKKRFSNLIKKIQKEEASYNTVYSTLSYITMIIGLYVFVLPYVSSDNQLMDSLKYGGIFGFVIFAIFDFTNLAIFKNYELSTAIFDIFWGSFLYFITTFLTIQFTSGEINDSSF
jgi:uncharacterized membrane protein